MADATGAIEAAEAEKPEEMLSKRYKLAGENAAKAYSRLYDQLSNKICSAHLEPLSKIMEEHEDGATLCDRENLVEVLKRQAASALKSGNRHLWETFGVDDSLAALEMLKEKFHEFEGSDWKIERQTPEQRTLPMRIRLKEVLIRTLQKQLERQNAELKDILQENAENRNCLQQMSQLQEIQKETIKNCRGHFQSVAAEIETAQKELWASEGEDIGD